MSYLIIKVPMKTLASTHLLGLLITPLWGPSIGVPCRLGGNSFLARPWDAFHSGKTASSVGGGTG